MKKTRILFACTNYGPIESEIYKNHLAVVSHASRMFDLPYIGVTDKMYTHTASNMLAEDALESCIDYVFFTENDMILPFNIIETLYNDIIKTKLDAISGLYFLRGDGTQPCLYNNGGNKENPFLHIPIVLVPENQIFTIDCCGMGCVLMNVDVFRKIDYPWFDLKEGKYGQDIYFYTKAKAAGIKVGVDTSVQCEHLCERRKVGIKDYREWLISKKTDKSGFVLTNPLKAMKPVHSLKEV